MSIYNDICAGIIKTDNHSFVPMSPEIVQTTSFYYETFEEYLDASNDEKNSFVSRLYWRKFAICNDLSNKTFSSLV